jgi:hypothetical protein
MIKEYLRKIFDTLQFGDPSDYDMIITFLKNKYYSKLIRNFWKFYEIKIPDDFIIRLDSKLKFQIDEVYCLDEEVNNMYFKEMALDISIDNLYDEFHYLNETRTSKLLYEINIINYSTFCVKYKSLIDNKLLINILNCVINALDGFKYDNILILYKAYLSLPYNIYYPEIYQGPLYGGTIDQIIEIKDIERSSYSVETITKWLRTENVFYYFSFNTINEEKFSLFEFTNIILVTIDERKELHEKKHGMLWNLDHDIFTHKRHLRASNITLLESDRLYKLLKIVFENKKYRNLRVFPWLYSNEILGFKVKQDYQNVLNIKPFNLFDINYLFINYNIIVTNIDNKLYEQYKINNNFLLMLDELNIIKINDFNRDHIFTNKDNHSDYKDGIIFEIIDESWKYDRNPSEEKYRIENIDEKSELYQMLLKDRDEAIKRAKLRYSKESHYKNKCHKYKLKYIKLKYNVL